MFPSKKPFPGESRCQSSRLFHQSEYQDQGGDRNTNRGIQPAIAAAPGDTLHTHVCDATLFAASFLSSLRKKLYSTPCTSHDPNSSSSNLFPSSTPILPVHKLQH